MKIIAGSPTMSAPMGEDEVVKFLGNKTNIQIATVDEDGNPNIQPVWFYYEKSNEKLYISTQNRTKKVTNIHKKPDVYFSVDEDTFPYRCVKGRATVEICEDPVRNVPVVEKIATKYIGSLDDPFSKTLVDMAKNKTSVVLELSPKFFSTWDFSKI